MELDVSFKYVCESLKKEGAQDSKLIEAIDSFLGLTIVCAPIALGPAALALLPILSVKNELTKIGRRVFGAATKNQGDDYLARLERMRNAYGLLVYTAFFEALDKAIPRELRKRLDLPTEEHRMLAELDSQPESASDARDALSESNATSVAHANALAEVPIGFPHPTQSLEEQTEAHQELWKQLSDGFGRFVQKLAVLNEMEEEDKQELRKTIDGLPERAAHTFVAQYVELSRKFPDFAIWANLHQHATTQAKVSKLASHVTNYIALSRHSLKTVDLGLAKLHEAITELRNQLEKGDAADILDGLARHYAARLDDPIIEDKEAPTEDGPKLSFPRIREAFVPQVFRVIRTTGRPLHLEDEKTWNELPPRDDLGPFLLSYLLSPYSTEAPLLILGHPGSGKSLLTKVLAALLAARHHSVVRVPLREVDADVGIVAQIEDAIGQVTKRRVDSWAALSAGFRDHPPIVILDGYDELLQASGKVYAGYLRDAKGFQKTEAEQGRPVRVIVTSRVTLIDKATVPPGSTVLRLLEFDTRRQQHWISVWNRANSKYFKEAEIEEFRLPEKDQEGAEKILSLAEQPLLLLMLALYDSQGNQLRRSVALDRTRLYDELLRRFVTRERGKARTFHDDLTADEQKAEIDKDMRRLGIAAIGMYNRRQVYILAEELEADLKFFDMLKDVTVSEGRPMSQADLLLGSFFFVHKSQAKRGDASAFEFLHNTLGEFLTADFILRWAIDEVQALAALKSQEALLPVFHEKLNSPDGLRRQWFASLVYTPLFTRPVVLEMMREWSGHLLDERNMNRDSFADHLDMVLHNQLERLISKRAMPSIMRDETVDEQFRARFGDHPLVGHIAVYSLNLVLLRVIVCDKPFVMDENAIKSYEDGARPWDRLVHLWRSWFSLEALNGLTAVIEAVRVGSAVEVRAKPTFQVAEARGRLDVLLNVSVAVADDLTAAVSGLAHSEVASIQDLRDIARRLASERIEADFQIAVRELQEATRNRGREVLGIKELMNRASKAMEIAVRERPRDDAERVALLFAAGVRAHLANRRQGENFAPRSDFAQRRNARADLGPAVDIRFIFRVFETSPEAALLWVKEIKHLVGGWVFRRPEAEELVERLLHGSPIWEILQESPTSLAAWVGVLRELGPYGWWRRESRGMFKRLIHPKMMQELVERSPETALSFLEVVHELGADAERTWREMGPEFMQRLLNPRVLLALAEQSPEAVPSLLRLLREWGDGQALYEMGRERAHEVVRNFIELAVKTPFLLDLIERSPEAAVEVVRVLQTLGDRDAIRGLMHPTVLERFSGGHFLLHLSERSPEAMIFMVQFLGERGGDSQQFWRQLGPEFMERLLDPRFLLALAERVPEAATTLPILLRQVDPDRAHHVVREIIELVLETPYLLELMNHSTSSLLEVLRLVRSLSRHEMLPGTIRPEVLERFFDQRFFVKLSERSPETVVAMVELLRELGGDSSRMRRRLGPQIAEKLLDPEHLLDISERSPEAALVLANFGAAMMPDDQRGRRSFGRLWDPRHVESILGDWLSRSDRDPRGFAAALFLARQFHSEAILRELALAVADAVQRESLPVVLPLAVLDDFRWLTSQDEAQEVRDVLLHAIPGLPFQGPRR